MCANGDAAFGEHGDGRRVDGQLAGEAVEERGTKPPPGTPYRLTLGLRWIVEATNSWWSNYGQLRRSTDRRIRHRHAALCLATVVLIVGRLIDHRDRWSA